MSTEQLIDCEGCWTHSIPIEACDGDRCPLCGSSMLTEQEDGFYPAVWGGGHGKEYKERREKAGEVEA